MRRKSVYLHDRSTIHIIEEGFELITHFEGTLFTTIKTVFLNPGKISSDYCNGIRKKYFKPLSFFFLLVVLYLIFPYFKGLNADLTVQIKGYWYSKYAGTKVRDLMTAKNVNFGSLNEQYHTISEKISKFLLFIIIPFMALVCWLSTFEKRRLFFDHFIFSTEINAFLILMGFLLLPVFVYLARNYFKSIRPVSDRALELAIILIEMVALGIFVYVAAKKFY